MLKTAVDIGSTTNNSGITTWASNYINKHGLDIVYFLKITKRKEAFPSLLKTLGKKDILNVMEFNSKGHAVFKWSSAEEKTMFLLKWS